MKQAGGKEITACPWQLIRMLHLRTQAKQTAKEELTQGQAATLVRVERLIDRSANTSPVHYI